MFELKIMLIGIEPPDLRSGNRLDVSGVFGRDWRNEEIRDFAKQMLPVLREHLRVAEDAALKLGINPNQPEEG